MTTRSRYTAAITDKPWWLAGGIPKENCLMAYKPIGAASYAASLVNLASPGRYDAAEGNAPTFNPTYGWVFSSGKEYLIISYSTTGYLSGIVRCSGFAGSVARVFSNNYLAAEGNFHIYPRYTDNKLYIRGFSASGANQSFTGTSGVFCSVPGGAFKDGVSLGKYAFSQQNTDNIGIARVRSDYWLGNIQAMAIFNIDISPYVPALTAAMNAL